MTFQLRPLVRNLVVALVLAQPLLSAHADSAAASRYYEDGLKRFEQDDVAGAIVQLKNALQQDRNMLAAQLLLGRAYLLQGELGPAEVAFNEALRLGVDPAEVTVPLGEIYLLQGRHAELLERVRADRVIGAAQVQALSMRGRAQAATGALDEAQRSFADARALDPASPVPLIAEVPVLITAGRIDAARARADAAVALAPTSAAAHNMRASVAHATGALTEALADYSRALELDEKHVDARVARAGIQIDLGNEDQAAEDLARLAADVPTEPRANFLRALLAGRQGDRQAEAALLTEVARVVDTLPAEWLASQEQLLMAGGLAHYSAGQLEKARKYLDVLVTRYPRNAGARKLLAAVHLDGQDYARAQTLLESVLRESPGDAQALFLIGRVHLALGRNTRAVEALERAVAAGEQGVGALASLSQGLLRTGDRSAALAALTQAFDKLPEDFGLASGLATMRLRSGDVAGGLDAARRHLAAGKQEGPEALHLLGQMQAASGDFAAARKSFEAALLSQGEFLPAKVGLVRLDVRAGAFDQARRTLDPLLRVHRNDAGLMYEYAQLERRAGRLAEAERWAEKALAEATDNLQIGLMLIELRSAAGNREGAREVARALAARRPGDMVALAALAQTDIDAGDNRAAQQTLREMVRGAGFDTERLVRIGYMQLAAADPAGARYSADKALQPQPKDLGALVLATESAVAERNIPLAAGYLETLAAAHGDHFQRYRLAGDIARERGEYAEAARLFHEAMARAPSAALLYRLADAHVRQGAPAKAIAPVRAHLEKSPNDVAARELLAELLMRSGQPREARDAYEALRASGRATPAVLNNLANLLLQLGEGDPLAYANEALRMAPGDAEVMDTVGWVLASQQRYEEAVRYLRDARLRAPNNAEIRWHLAYVLSKMDRRAEAADELRAAVVMPGDFSWRSEASALLAELAGK